MKTKVIFLTLSLLLYVATINAQCVNTGGCNCPSDASIMVFDTSSTGCGGTINVNWPSNGNNTGNIEVVSIPPLSFANNGGGFGGTPPTVWTAVSVPPGEYCISIEWSCWSYSTCNNITGNPAVLNESLQTLNPASANNNSCSDGSLEITRTDAMCQVLTYTILTHTVNGCATGSSGGNISIPYNTSGTIPDLKSGDYTIEVKNGAIPLDTIPFNIGCGDALPPVISYTPLSYPSYCTPGSTFTLLANISDCHDVPTGGIGLPVLYWKRNSGSYATVQGTYVSGTQYSFTFGTGSNTFGDTISYFIVAQDNANNVGAFPSGNASGFSINPPACSVPPDNPSSFILPLYPPIINYSPISNIGCAPFNLSLNADIDTGSACFSIPTSGIGLPVLYWKINSGSYQSVQATYVSGSSYNFSFMPPATYGDTLRYYLAAQNDMNIVSIHPSAGASGFTALPPACAIPPTNPNIIIFQSQAPIITYTPITSISCSSPNINLNTNINADGFCIGIPTSGIGLPVLYWKINSGSYQTVQATYGGGSNYNFSFAPTAISGDTLRYYVAAQNDVGTVSIQPSTGASGFTSSPPACSVPPLAPSTFIYPQVLNGTYTVGAGGQFETLTDAVTAYNTMCISGQVVFELISTTYPSETFPITINSQPNSSATNNLTIRSTVNTNVTISNSSGLGILVFNGASYVTVDGNTNNGSTLLLRNIASSSSTIRLTNSATYNKFLNLTIEGGGTASGVFRMESGLSGAGNTGNKIMDCTLRNRSDGTGTPTYMILINSSAKAINDSIINCNIFNFTNTAIYSSGADAVLVLENNNIYQLDTRTTATTGILINGSSGGHKIINNYIGGNDPQAGGGHWATNNVFTGIDLSINSSNSSLVEGNVIRNIRSTYTTGYNASRGLYLRSGLATITGNNVGSSDVNQRIEINGDSRAMEIVSNDNILINNNSINNFKMTATPPSGTYYYGLLCSGAGSHTIENNTIQNLQNNSVPDATYNVRTFCIYNYATGVQTVKNNTIFDCGNGRTNAPTANNYLIWGIYMENSAANSTVENNRIYNLYSLSLGTGDRADFVQGILLGGSANTIVKNNMISLNNGSNSLDRIIRGINDLTTSSSQKIYNNSIYIYGNASGSNKTQCFIRFYTSSVDIKNNNFSNTRTGGSGYHLAISNAASSATGWPANASNYNNLYASNSNAIGEWWVTPSSPNKTLAQWRASTNGDMQSVSALPEFTSNTDLHVHTSYNPALSGSGITLPLVTIDIDGESRNSPPDIGVDEYDHICNTNLTSGANSGPGTMREILKCILPGDTIIYDPNGPIDTIYITGPMKIDRNVTLLGMNNATKSVIDLDFGHPNFAGAQHGIRVASEAHVKMKNLRIIDRNNPNASSPSLLPVMEVLGILNIKESCDIIKQ